MACVARKIIIIYFLKLKKHFKNINLEKNINININTLIIE
jgi:hypothetical protein